MRPWVAFFSQTGTEINNLCKSLGIYPDAIVTNKQTTEGINKELFSTTTFREHKLNKTIYYMLPERPLLESYKIILSNFETPVITLHGYLRIIPKEICEKFEMYNLHPGLITKYPELKGFNPQERAFKGQYKDAGCVIHRVTAGVDEGEIVASGETDIEGLNLDQVYEELRSCALNTWISFIQEYKIIQK